jgi:hypothetical protein
LKNSQSAPGGTVDWRVISANTQKSAEIKQIETLTSICRNDSEDNHEFLENMFDKEHKIMEVLKTPNSLR